LSNSGRDSDRKQVQRQRQQPGTGTAAGNSDSGSLQRQRQQGPIAVIESALSIDQPPGHGANLVENRKRLLGLGSMDGSSLSEKPHVAIDFLGGRIGNPPVVETISLPDRPWPSARFAGTELAQRTT
jgi:hypothetical protein